jgi:hypothetical protein
MKHLKTTSHDLRELFERGITIKNIAEALVSFDEHTAASEVYDCMCDKDYDVVGVRQLGVVRGYVQRDSVGDGELGAYMQPFEPDALLAESASLLRVFAAMRGSSHVFVVIFGEVGGIVTRGDLQKAPVRMWLFGLISLIEMQLLRIIREGYPDDSWQPLLSEHRLYLAQKLLSDRQRRNEAIDLEDCLQFADKRTILLKSRKLWKQMDFGSKSAGESLLEDLEKLRNRLAHAQDIMHDDSLKIIELATDAERFLHCCENLIPGE